MLFIIINHSLKVYMQEVTSTLLLWYSQWSYGVTMWEIFSGGKAPFPGTNPVNLMQMLEEGDRMPKPNSAACTEEM